MRSAMSSWTNRTRGADSADRRSGRPDGVAERPARAARRSTIMAFMPPVSAINGRIGLGLRHRRLMVGGLVGTGEGDAVDAGIGRAPADDGPLARQQHQGGARNAGAVQQVTRRSESARFASAGLAITPLPAARAAASCPVKIASGKFQGLIARTRRARAASAGCARRSGPEASSARQTGGAPQPA